MIDISSNRLNRLLTDICEIGPRWPGDAGEKNVLAYLENYLSNELTTDVCKESFVYQSFKPEKGQLTILNSREKLVECQPLAYSASQVIEGELIYLPEESIGITPCVGKIVLTDALKSYQAYPKACESGAAGFILGTTLPGNLLRVGTTNYERKIGSIPGVTIGGVDTHTLKELALQDLTVRLEVAAAYGDATSYNLRVRLQNSISAPMFMVCSHYDSMWLGPHAFDNASGTAAMLELIRFFKGMPYNLEFLFFGVEELGFWGSNAFVQRHLPELNELAGVICLDGICSDLGQVEIGASDIISNQIRQVARAENFQVDVWSIPPRPNSDHVSFKPLGIPIFWLTTMDPYYHTAMDVPENISMMKLKHHTAFAAQVIMNLSNQNDFAI